jgi:cysteine desulfurase/selenocysteine lyase
MPLDVAAIKADFPILQRKVRHDNPLIYLDSGATSQKPIQVIDAVSNFYKFHNSAVHRGAHLIAEEATDAYEGAREKVAKFIDGDLDEVIFTKSATESLNALAYSIGNAAKGSPFYLDETSEILVSELEHHANLIPWQELARRTGAKLTWFEIDEEARLDYSNIDQLINEKTKIIAITHQSNVSGAITDLPAIVERAKAVGAITILDACQSAPHMAISVKKLGVDFYAFSGHKAVGPTGIGILWGRADLLDQLPPFLYGGSMVTAVTMSGATFAKSPRKFEAGVPNMAGAVGLGVALDYLSNIGMDAIHQHEIALTQYSLEKLAQVEGLTVIGPKNVELRGAVLSFTVDGIHPHDLGQALDENGIAVRTGHHCAWPLMKTMKLVATTRASLYLYNDFQDLDHLISGIESAKKFFLKSGR